MMTNDLHTKFMRRALNLAKRGYGFVNPNPLVGSVIAKDGSIVAEGYHQRFGGPHAEVHAIGKLTENTGDLTLYVNLEPCSFTGKTPPCTDLIIRTGIKKVVTAMEDPNPRISGKGIEILRENGVDVTTGVLEEDARKLNETYVKYITTRLPFCTLKVATTLDGRIAAPGGRSQWISCERSRKLVMDLRHRYSAVMTGAGTVISDNPRLTDRSGSREKKDPFRIILDSRGRIPAGARIFDAVDQKTILATTGKAPREHLARLEQKGIRIVVCPEKDDHVDLAFLLQEMGRSGIDSILVEGGSILNYSLLSGGLADKYIFFVAPILLGGREAMPSFGGKGAERLEDAWKVRIENIKQLGRDVMIEAYPVQTKQPCSPD
jgi:diaminohydroxyphosphoribosylaminopyrimidine deaminase/5-amino-6-(5-phosphoribosylamino)uracil reductase